MDLNSIIQYMSLNTNQIFGISLEILLIILVVDLILKGLAMWKAVEKREKIWFWALLVTNTLGILPLIYLYIRRKK